MATSITAITSASQQTGGQGARQFQGLFDCIPFSVALTDATLPAQTSSQVDLTVTGAALGDFVILAAEVDLAGGVLSGAVTAANTVTVTLFNTEGTDAITVLSAGPTVNGLILKARDNVWADPDG